MIERPSPNFDPRRRPVDMLLLHYTGMTDAASAVERLCDPAAKVSAHYLVDENGTVCRLVDEAQRAWHAGVSRWGGETDVNSCSIGIELVNPGHEYGYRPFPEPQMAALVELAGGIVRRHRIPPARVLGHSDVAPARKQDPGELFDWARLARHGIGLWPHGLAGGLPGDAAAVRSGLQRFGYDCSAGLQIALAAFQRHWRPSRVDGRLDDETAGRLAALLDCAGLRD